MTTANSYIPDLVSIVVAVKNRQDSLERLLVSIERQDYKDREILIVDDGSEPPICQEMAGIKYLRNQQSLGTTVARNSGMILSRGEFIVIFDDDAEIRDTILLTRAVVLARRFPKCGAIGFRQLRADGSASYMQPSTATALAYAGHFFCTAAYCARRLCGGSACLNQPSDIIARK